MNNPIYCSTGAFIGRINGRNHRLLTEYGGKFKCDGFEVMVFGDWYDNIESVTSDIKSSGIPCPVIHSDKNIGDATKDGADMRETVELWKTNCDFGAEIGAKKVVAHIWGYPDSDRDPEHIYYRCGILKDIAKGFGLDLLVENVVCSNSNPLAHLEALARIYPDVGVIIDTRCTQFHEEFDELNRSFLWKSGNIRHIHINDYAGGYMNWENVHKILQPGRGGVDFGRFFEHLRAVGYSGSITLEAPSMLEDGVDLPTLNGSLDFIRRGINGIT